MVESSQTHTRELEIYNRTPTGGLKGEEVAKYVGISGKVHDLRIGDIGAGASNFTALMVKNGADAYAIDPRYDDLRKLEEEYFAFLDRNVALYGEDFIKQYRRAYQMFKESFRKTPQRYKAAFALNLPFRNGFFHSLISNAAIFGHLDEDYDLLEEVTAEALRVTRSGGRIVYAPIGDLFEYLDTPQMRETRHKNRERLEQWLSGRSVRWRIETFRVSAVDVSRFVIMPS